MTDDDRATPQPTQPDDGTRRVRPGRDVAAATRLPLGTIVVVVLLLAAAAYLARSPLDPGDASATDDPAPTSSLVIQASPASSPAETVASASSRSPSPTEPVEPAPTLAARPTDEPARPTPVPPPTAEPTPEPTPYDDPDLATVGSSWTTAPADELTGRLEIVGECLEKQPNPYTGERFATVRFRISWDGTVSLGRIVGDFGDGDNELGHGSGLPLPSADAYDVVMTMRPRQTFDIDFFFYEVDPSATGASDGGRLVGEIDGTFSIDPHNVC